MTARTLRLKAKPELEGKEEEIRTVILWLLCGQILAQSPLWETNYHLIGPNGQAVSIAQAVARECLSLLAQTWLIHYRFGVGNSPVTVKHDVMTSKEGTTHLWYVEQKPNGRFAPVSAQENG